MHGCTHIPTFPPPYAFLSIYSSYDMNTLLSALSPSLPRRWCLYIACTPLAMENSRCCSFLLIVVAVIYPPLRSFILQPIPFLIPFSGSILGSHSEVGGCLGPFTVCFLSSFPCPCLRFILIFSALTSGNQSAPSSPPREERFVTLYILYGTNHLPIPLPPEMYFGFSLSILSFSTWIIQLYIR